ncbi:MAG TPA: penicillin acylase family protein [Ktedonobacterales bacterium]|nr:penicillin acylase family protein [Ktedonobacterales bacterium]
MSAESQESVAVHRGTARAGQSWSRRLARGFVIGLTVALCLVIILAGAGVFYAQQTLPQTSGSLAVTGLQARVSVARDTYGVPHITAQNRHDLFFAQGYVTAQDRLFQMEFNRSVAQGRLAALFGAGSANSLVDADAFLRTLDFYQSARAELNGLDPSVKVELQGYADGVNAFVATHPHTLPLEFTILGVSWQPWTPLDSLAYGRVVAFSLDNSWYIKYTRALVTAKAGPGVDDALFPSYPVTNPTLFADTPNTAAPVTASGSGVAPIGQTSAPLAATPSQRALFATLPVSLFAGATVVHDMLGSLRDSIGSNDWVVDGSRTASHLPMLANDPHLGIAMPSIWYEIALNSGGFDVIGFSFPGDPGVVVGHNQRIAWGVTNVGADNSDLYYERLDPKNHPGEYYYEGYWLPLRTRTETIDVRGGKSVTITVTSTEHGPLINGVVGAVKGLPPLALKWTALQPGYSFQGFFKLDAALNWNQFLAALSQISISQNFVYADVDGNIGYRMSGLLPLRPVANRLGPVDGSVSTYEWQGYVPQSAMPTLFNPPTHIIATANQQIVSDNYPEYVTNTWDQGYRARRIVDLLSAKTNLTPQDFEVIQADVYNEAAATLTPRLIAAGEASGGDAARAAALLHGWDYRMTRDSTAASLFEVAAGDLARETMEPVLGKQLYTVYQSNTSAGEIYSVLINLTALPVGPFFGIRNVTDANASRDKAIARAMSDAYAQLEARFGPDTSTWRWGTMHTATFAHPLASVTPLNLIFGVAPLQRPGDSATVNVGGDGGFSADPPNYAQHTVSSMREIIDLAHLDNSVWVTTTGESGQPFSTHYQDLTHLWDTNTYQPMDYTPASVAKRIVSVLTLTPK